MAELLTALDAFLQEHRAGIWGAVGGQMGLDEL